MPDDRIPVILQEASQKKKKTSDFFTWLPGIFQAKANPYRRTTAKIKRMYEITVFKIISVFN